jgi:hypothetical protein
MRRYAAEHEVSPETAIELGMKEKAAEFTTGGGEVYPHPRPRGSSPSGET